MLLTFCACATWANGSVMRYAGVIVSNPIGNGTLSNARTQNSRSIGSAEIIVKISKSEKVEVIAVQRAKDIETLRRLESGDFIAIQGVRRADDRIELRSVDYVGLSRLQGTWTSSDNKCYHFRNFSRLIVSKRIAWAECPDLVRAGGISLTSREYRYFITPGGDDWDLLFSDEQNFYSAEFNFVTKNEVKMTIFDSNTGQRLSEFYLRK